MAQLISSLTNHRELIWAMTKREIIGRYRGSIMGVSWFLSSLGVFIRDIGQIIGVALTVMMFVSPVFFPVSALPEKYQIFIMLNPLTFIMEQAREVVIGGKLPDWYGLAIYIGASLLVAQLGFAWLQKTRKGFADVL